MISHCYFSLPRTGTNSQKTVSLLRETVKYRANYTQSLNYPDKGPIILAKKIAIETVHKTSSNITFPYTVVLYSLQTAKKLDLFV